MKHPWLSARMIIASTVLFAVYGMIALFLFTAGGIIAALIGTIAFIGLQYFGTIKIAMWRTNAERIPERQYPELHKRADELAEKMDIARPTLYFARFNEMNAFALGRRGHGYVFITPIMLERLNTDELECILGHEFAHLRNRDVVLTNLGNSLSSLLSSGILIAFLLFSLDSDNPVLVRVVGAVVSTIVYLFLLVLVGIITRYREYVADAEAVHYTEKPEQMRSALMKTQAFYEREDAPEVSTSMKALCITSGQQGLLDRLLDSHPPMEKRVERVTEMLHDS